MSASAFVKSLRLYVPSPETSSRHVGAIRLTVLETPVVVARRADVRAGDRRPVEGDRCVRVRIRRVRRSVPVEEGAEDRSADPGHIDRTCPAPTHASVAELADVRVRDGQPIRQEREVRTRAGARIARARGLRVDVLPALRIRILLAVDVRVLRDRAVAGGVAVGLEDVRLVAPATWSSFCVEVWLMLNVSLPFPVCVEGRRPSLQARTASVRQRGGRLGCVCVVRVARGETALCRVLTLSLGLRCVCGRNTVTVLVQCPTSPL